MQYNMNLIRTQHSSKYEKSIKVFTKGYDSIHQMLVYAIPTYMFANYIRGVEMTGVVRTMPHWQSLTMMRN